MPTGATTASVAVAISMATARPISSPPAMTATATTAACGVLSPACPAAHLHEAGELPGRRGTPVGEDRGHERRRTAGPGRGQLWPGIGRHGHPRGVDSAAGRAQERQLSRTGQLPDTRWIARCCRGRSERRRQARRSRRRPRADAKRQHFGTRCRIRRTPARCSPRPAIRGSDSRSGWQSGISMATAWPTLRPPTAQAPRSCCRSAASRASSRPPCRWANKKARGPAAPRFCALTRA